MHKMKEENDAQSGGSTLDAKHLLTKPNAPESSSRNASGRRMYSLKNLKATTP